MEEKNNDKKEKKMVKLSFGTVTCLAIIFAIVVVTMGCICYFNLREQKENLIDNEIIPNIIKNDEENEIPKGDTSYEDLSESIQRYLDLVAAKQAETHSIIILLGLTNEYKDYEIVERENGEEYQKTDIKYSDFENAILNFMTKKLYEKEFSKLYEKDEDGYLLIKSVESNAYSIKVLDVEKISDNNYNVKTKWYGLDDEEGTDINWKVKTETHNGKYVIDEIDQIK